MMRNDEWFQCGDKERHLTKRSAREHKRSLLAHYGERKANIYRCPYCGFFHVGRTSAPVKRRVLRSKRVNRYRPHKRRRHKVVW